MFAVHSLNSWRVATIRFGSLQPSRGRQPNFVKCSVNNKENKRVKRALLSATIGIGIALLCPLTCTAETPYSQSQSLQLGLENGRIRPCPSWNPNCISTTSRSASFAVPWSIPSDSADNALKKIEDAIEKTQRNPKIVSIEDTPSGRYLQAEVDGVLGRDVLEFLVKTDVVTYRTMAKKVVYVYPFTTAFGNSKGQEERMEKIVEALGWYVPSFNDVLN